MAFRPRHTARRHLPHAVGTVVGYARGYCLNAGRGTVELISRELGRIRIKSGQTHICVGHRQREDSTHSPSAGSYHSGPETVGAAYIIAACSHHMVHRAGTTIRSVRRKPLDKLLNHTRHTPRMYRKHPHRGLVGSRWLSRMGIVNLTASNAAYLHAEGLSEGFGSRARIALPGKIVYHIAEIILPSPGWLRIRIRGTRRPAHHTTCIYKKAPSVSPCATLPHPCRG